ncbi:MAG: glutathione S-transferase family protein [Pseudomonadota bacterium]
MKLNRDAITTTEVLDWRGLHLLNFSQSSCSQKVRILLREKNVPYRSHEINLKKAAHTTPWYLGINARGVVPVLIHDGDVHVESNDLLHYIDKTFSGWGASWIPADPTARSLAKHLLDLEDRLHGHLRVVTMGFLLPRRIARKSDAELNAYAANGADDPYREKQIAWWRAFGREGITEQQALDAVAAFHDAFRELDGILETRPWLLGDNPSVTDIAWFITLYRADLAGYPLHVHEALFRAYERMGQRPAFRTEIRKGPALIHIIGPLYRAYRRLRGTSLLKYFERWRASLASAPESGRLSDDAAENCPRGARAS